ncbi:hypothetical protein FACS1894181_02470 [Bacteroidia bacterium]|nr:hypothetical protein FACS1894181_02470 [Bacteroidia bacterium]
MNKDELILSVSKLTYNLHVDEHQEYVSLVIAAIEARVLAIGDPALAAVWNPFKTYGTIEDLLYRQPKSAEETVVITGLNIKRTDSLTYVLNVIENAAKRSPLPAEKENAKHLDHLSEPYKKAAAKNIPAKTADIRNFVLDLKLEPNATYAEALHLTEAVLALEAENNELESNYVLRAQLWLEKEQYGSLTQLRPLEDDAMQEVADTLKVLYKANERVTKDEALHAKFEAIFTAWNAITEQFDRVLAQRGTKISRDKPSPNYPTPPAEPEPPSPPSPPDFE